MAWQTVIYIVTHAEGRYSVEMLLAGWGRELSNHARLFDYPTVFRRKHIPLGCYIFTGPARDQQV